MHKSRVYMECHVALEPPAGERNIVITVGSDHDLDAIVRPARPGRPALTLRDALGDHVQHLDAIDEAGRASDRVAAERARQARQAAEDAAKAAADAAGSTYTAPISVPETAVAETAATGQAPAPNSDQE